MKICCYGSSVAEQSKLHTTGETVGYVDFLQVLYAGKPVRVERIARGACNLQDGGLLMLDDVVRAKPDICILDWCSANAPNADMNTVSHVYDTLLANGIFPLTVVFPRKDRNNFATGIHNHSRKYSLKYNLPFVAIASEASLDDILRDVVHTNARGGELYAREISRAIDAVVENCDHNSKRRNPLFAFLCKFGFTRLMGCAVTGDRLVERVLAEHPGELSAESADRVYIHCGEIEYSYTAGIIDAFRLRLPESLSALAPATATIQLFMDSMVGPCSPILETAAVSADGSCTTIGAIPVIDRWCYRERKALKAVTPVVDLPACEILCDTVQNDAAYAAIPMNQEISESITTRTLKDIAKVYFIIRSRKRIENALQMKFHFTTG